MSVQPCSNLESSTLIFFQASAAEDSSTRSTINSVTILKKPSVSKPWTSSSVDSSRVMNSCFKLSDMFWQTIRRGNSRWCTEFESIRSKSATTPLASAPNRSCSSADSSSSRFRMKASARDSTLPCVTSDSGVRSLSREDAKSESSGRGVKLGRLFLGPRRHDSSVVGRAPRGSVWKSDMKNASLKKKEKRLVQKNLGEKTQGFLT